MKVVKPDWRIVALTEADPTRLMKHLEAMGRICYQSEDAITDKSYAPFLKGIIKRGHEAVLEHASVTAVVTCDRGITHEIVRHRIAAYCQESTRYCNYSKGKFGNEIAVVEPPSGTPMVLSTRFGMTRVLRPKLLISSCWTWGALLRRPEMFCPTA